jgi:hypothetical protein
MFKKIQILLVRCLLALPILASSFITGSTSNYALAQESSLIWANHIGGPDTEGPRHVGLDSLGNVYTIGIFFGTVDFDPSIDVFNLTGSNNLNLFVQKLDANGNFIWALNVQAESNSAYVDSAGNTYINGSFKGEIDFDPSTSIHTLTAPTESSFVLKINTHGQFVWAKQIENSGSLVTLGIAVDTQGNVYSTGTFAGMIDFDTGSGIYNLTSNGLYDAFIHKIDANGYFQWVVKFGKNTTNDVGRGLAVDVFGNVYVTGETGPNNTFILKLDLGGNIKWLAEFASSRIGDIVLDDLGNIFLTGTLLGTTDFDPGPSEYILTSTPYNAFIFSLDTNGNFRWAEKWGGGAGWIEAHGITLDSANNIFITGAFRFEHDFDPGPSIFNLNAGSGNYSGYSGYVSKLDNNGKFIWAGAMPSDGSCSVTSIVADDNGNVYITGYFEGSIDVDPTTNVLPLTSVTKGMDLFDLFTLKLFIPPSFNRSPSVNAGGPYTISEGGSTLVAATGSDPENDPLSFAWDLDNDGIFETLGQNAVFSSAVLDGPSIQSIAVQVIDTGDLTATAQTSINILNVAPDVETITGPNDPVNVGGPISLTTIFTDPGVLDTHTAYINWGDDSTSVGTINEENGSGSVTATHVYNTPGVYAVSTTVIDKDGGIGQAFFQFVVIYDPNGGFVTGHGKINSPFGAYTADPTLAGKASFGFVSKYAKGANVPSGETKFQFKVADLNFQSTNYQWLVISGARAQYKGVGTINGTGAYGFLLTAIDGQVSGGGEIDRFRVKIWDNATGSVIYDNQLGAHDSDLPTTAVDVGNVVIHKLK